MQQISWSINLNLKILLFSKWTFYNHNSLRSNKAKAFSYFKYKIICGIYQLFLNFFTLTVALIQIIVIQILMHCFADYN